MTQTEQTEKENMIIDMAELIKEKRQSQADNFKLCKRIEQLETMLENRNKYIALRIVM